MELVDDGVDDEVEGMVVLNPKEQKNVDNER